MTTCFRAVEGPPRSHMLIYQAGESCGEINAAQVHPVKIVDQISCKPYVTTSGGWRGLEPSQQCLLLPVNLLQKTPQSVQSEFVRVNQ